MSKREDALEAALCWVTSGMMGVRSVMRSGRIKNAETILDSTINYSLNVLAKSPHIPWQNMAGELSRAKDYQERSKAKSRRVKL